MKKFLPVILLIFLLSGCTLAEFIIDPIGSINNSQNTTTRRSQNSTSSSNKVTTNPSIQTPAAEPKDTIAPIFTGNYHLPSKFSTREAININQIDSFDFDPAKIDLYAFDLRDGDISSSITYAPLGLLESSNGNIYFYVRYSIRDKAGNGIRIDIPFRAYETILINEKNFYEYFQVEQNIYGGLVSQGTTAVINVNLKPKEGISRLIVESSDLSLNYRLNLNWSQELRQRATGNYAGVLLSTSSHSKVIPVSKAIPSNTIITTQNYKETPFMSYYGYIENTASWTESSKFNTKFKPPVYWDAIRRSSSLTITGSLLIKDYVTS